jgi:hypothetical protein
MSKSLLTKVTALTIAITIAGCAAERKQTIESNNRILATGVRALNQPEINELEKVTSYASSAEFEAKRLETLASINTDGVVKDNGAKTLVTKNLFSTPQFGDGVESSSGVLEDGSNIDITKLVPKSSSKPSVDSKAVKGKDVSQVAMSTNPEDGSAIDITKLAPKSSPTPQLNTNDGSSNVVNHLSVESQNTMTTNAEYGSAIDMAQLVPKPSSLPPLSSNAVSNQSTTVSDAPVKSNKMEMYYTYEGEAYEEAISRWLNKAGFERVGFLLDVSEKRILSRSVAKYTKQYESISYAISDLIAKAIANDAEKLKIEAKSKNGVLSGISDMEYAEGEQDGVQSKGVRIEARLNSTMKQAIITSSTLPTVMFMVEEGNVKDNYIRLAKFYNWNAKDEYYLATNYRISFGFPIVTEEGNIKLALEKLLAPFYDLRAAIVPSIRQAYVLKEKE